MRNDVTFAIISEYEKWMNNDFILAVNKKVPKNIVQYEWKIVAFEFTHT